jgi:carbamate kinase
MTVTEAKQYLAEGTHFAKGSMAPKIQAAINFLEAGGQRVIITNPDNLELALEGKTGTHITR